MLLRRGSAETYLGNLALGRRADFEQELSRLEIEHSGPRYWEGNVWILVLKSRTTAFVSSVARVLDRVFQYA